MSSELDYQPTDRSELDTAVSDTVSARVTASVPHETRRAHGGDWTRFTAWCTSTGRTALPATPEPPGPGARGGRAGSAHGASHATGRLSAKTAADVVERLALTGAWSGHSLRRGFATTARAAGHDPLEIARQGGWADGSRTLARYMAEADRVTNAPTVGIAACEISIAPGATVPQLLTAIAPHSAGRITKTSSELVGLGTGGLAYSTVASRPG